MRRTMSKLAAAVLLLGLASVSAFDRPHLRMTLAATGEQVMPTSEDLAEHQVCGWVGGWVGSMVVVFGWVGGFCVRAWHGIRHCRSLALLLEACHPPMRAPTVPAGLFISIQSSCCVCVSVCVRVAWG